MTKYRTDSLMITAPDDVNRNDAVTMAHTVLARRAVIRKTYDRSEPITPIQMVRWASERGASDADYRATFNAALAREIRTAPIEMIGAAEDAFRADAEEYPCRDGQPPILRDVSGPYYVNPIAMPAGWRVELTDQKQFPKQVGMTAVDTEYLCGWPDRGLI